MDIVTLFHILLWQYWIGEDMVMKKYDYLIVGSGLFGAVEPCIYAQH